MANPSWFDEYAYLNSKLNQLKAAGNTQYSTINQVKTAIEAAGMTTYQHFSQFSLAERTSPNDYFNTNEYLAAKAKSLGGTWTADKVALAFQNAGYTNAYQHFTTFGWTENVNPSNAFDVSAYLQLKADQTGLTVAEVTDAFKANGFDPVSHYMAVGSTETGMAVTPVPAAEQVTGDTSGTAGQTFTLTTSIDNFTGSSSDDTFIGDAGSASAADQLNGGAGTDTLKLYGNAAEPTHSGVEVVYLNGNTAGFNVSDNANVTTLQLDAVATAQTYTIASGQSASIANQGTQTIDFAGNTVASLALALNKAGSVSAGTTTTIDFNSTAQTSLAITTASNASNIAIANTGAKLVTLTVAGDQAITIDAKTATNALFTTVDATLSTGNVSVTLDDATAKDITVTGGSGNDTANFGALFTKADKFDGGIGTDKLAITQASLTTVNAYGTEDKATVNANLANIESLAITDALTSNIDASRFDSVNSFVLMAGNNAGGTATISKVTSGVTVTMNDAAGANTNVTAVEIIDATVAGNNSDTVNISLNDDGAGGASDMGVVNLVGTDILNVSTASTVAATGVAGTTTSYVLDIANTSTALDTLTITGSIGIDMNDVALVNSIQTVSASGMTLTSVTSTGVSVDIAQGGTNGVFITGSMGVDTIGGSAAADIIDGGSGVDTIDGDGGADKITGGAGNDIFTIDSGETGLTSTTCVTITDYVNTSSTSSSDKLDFTGAAVIGSGTGVTGWTVVGGVATKTGATVSDFITAAAGADTANEVYVFNDGTDSYVYFNGANDDTSTADDALVKLTGVQITSVVTTDTTAANELFIA